MYKRGVGMLDNNKCILVYGLSNIELLNLSELGYKIIEITPEMCEMTLMDVLKGTRLDIFNCNPIKEKVIFDTRKKIKYGILAVVTEQSINWKINHLIKHLKDEKEWYSKVRKEKDNE